MPAVFQEKFQAAFRAWMVDLSKVGIGRSRAVPRAKGHIRTILAQGKRRKGDPMAMPDEKEGRVMLPDKS